MSKALELTVYAKSRGWFGAQYDLPGGRHMLAREGADVMSRNKRLTDAELAAEYWLGLNEKQGPHGLNRPLTWDQLDTLYELATLPHYDEAQA